MSSESSALIDSEEAESFYHSLVSLVLSIKGIRFLVPLAVFWGALERSLSLLAAAIAPDASDATVVGIWWAFVPALFLVLSIVEFIVIKTFEPISQKQRKHTKPKSIRQTIHTHT